MRVINFTVVKVAHFYYTKKINVMIIVLESDLNINLNLEAHCLYLFSPASHIF